MLFTDATLRAYAGNELDLPDADALEVMLAAEPQLARRAVLALVERRLAEPRTEQPSLAGVGVSAPRGLSYEAARPAFSPGVPPVILPVGVGLGTALLCVAVGFLAGQASSPARPISLGTIENSGMRTALERVPTGGVEDLPDGRFRAVASFVTGAGWLLPSIQSRAGIGHH
jgi:anti-sigma factor RsiW